MNRIILLVFALLYCLTSCVKKNSLQEGAIQSNIDSAKSIKLIPSIIKQINLSSLIKNIKVIPLQTDKESLLAKISKIDFDDTHYFIQNSQDKLVYVFDSIGNFNYRIGNKGVGPGEILFPECFALNKKKKELWLINNASEFYKYDYSGKFKNKTAFKIFCNDFFIQNDSTIYFHTSKRKNFSNNGKNILCWNLWIKDNDNTECFFPYSYDVHPSGSLSFETRTPFSVYNDSVTYHYIFTDTIYSIIENKVSPKYIVDFGNKKSSLNFSTTPGEKVSDYIKANSKDAFFVQNVLECSDFLMFNYVMSQERYKVLYSKKSNKLVEGILINDITGSNIEFICIINNKFIGYIEPEKFKESEKTNLFISPNQKKLLLNLDEESNPILVVCEFKDL